MAELLILDLVLLVGIAVLPRHVGRSYLAIRRMVKEGLREATAREPRPAPAVARAYLAGTVRAARGALSAEPFRPARLPAAAALVATVLVAGYATWAKPMPAPAGATMERVASFYLPFEGFGAGAQAALEAPEAPELEAPEAPEAEESVVVCDATDRIREARLREAAVLRIQLQEMREELAEEMAQDMVRRWETRESHEVSRDVLEATYQAVRGIRIRIL